MTKAPRSAAVPLREVARTVSADGSAKFLYALADGAEVESVFLPLAGRRTVCVSSQVGCVLDCSFCATARLGFRRNLTADEITAQVAAVESWSQSSGAMRVDVGDPEERHRQGRITNVVFMGMGEPFYNYDNVLNAAVRLADQRGPAIAARRITISTAGVLPAIERYFREDHPYKLAISVSAALSKKRDLLMPINRRFPLQEIGALLRSAPARAIRRVMLEVPLLAGINDSDEDALARLDFCRGLPVRVNLIAWNPVAGLLPAGAVAFERPEQDRLLRFQSIVRRDGHPVFIRKSLGLDIAGACGQLAGSRPSGSA